MNGAKLTLLSGNVNICRKNCWLLFWRTLWEGRALSSEKLYAFWWNLFLGGKLLVLLGEGSWEVIFQLTTENSMGVSGKRMFKIAKCWVTFYLLI